MFTRSYIGLAVSFKGPNVMLELYKCNYSLTRGMDRGPCVCYLCYRWYCILSAVSSRSKNAVVVSLLGDTEIDGWVGAWSGLPGSFFKRFIKWI